MPFIGFLLRIGRVKALRGLTLASAIFAVALLSPAAGAHSDGGNPFTGVSRNTSVFFLPLDAHARQVLTAAAPSLRPWTQSDQVLLPAFATKPAWIDSARFGERKSKAIALDLLTNFRSAQGARQVLVMAVTSEAIYDEDNPALNFDFGAWQKRHYNQFAAVLGTRPMRVVQPSRERARLTKMMLRYIGEIACGLPRNLDPHSVMYAHITSTVDLDRMRATLPARCRYH